MVLKAQPAVMNEAMQAMRRDILSTPGVRLVL